MSQEKLWSVSEVNSAMRELIENSLMPFWLRAEVGTLNIHSSGHVYLTLKDRRSQVRAVFFSGAASAREMRLKVGSEVEVFGKLTVYEVRGEYQFSIKQIRPVGLGDLQRRFEELKRKLEAEGLFAPERKQSIPLLPRCIGVVTSPDGAAVRDFLQIINRRFPDLHIRIYPAPVQGVGAERRLAAGVEFFNRSGLADVIVLTRGGGSMEDLWPFNEEILARTIAACRVPVISAVGHEIDFTICDFVADLRVPTPSAAAELVAGNREELETRLQRLGKDLRSTLTLFIQEFKSRLRSAAESYVFREPLHLLRQKQQTVDELTRELSILLEQKSSQERHRLELLENQLRSAAPIAEVNAGRVELCSLDKNLAFAVRQRLERLEAVRGAFEGRLKALDPRNVLRRGYSIITDPATGNTVKEPQPSGKQLHARLANGELHLRVE